MSTVHNHSPYRPVCNERIIGACMVTIDPADIPHLGDFADDPREALHIIADNVRDIAQGDLDATEQIVRWLADLLPKPPKPAEPTGLGAVVEDANGQRWVRATANTDDDCAWVRAERYQTRGEAWCYESYDMCVPAVRVLSEGVTA